jgi:hypothetical protein
MSIWYANLATERYEIDLVNDQQRTFVKFPISGHMIGDRFQISQTLTQWDPVVLTFVDHWRDPNAISIATVGGEDLGWVPIYTKLECPLFLGIDNWEMQDSVLVDLSSTVELYRYVETCFCSPIA